MENLGSLGQNLIGRSLPRVLVIGWARDLKQNEAPFLLWACDRLENNNYLDLGTIWSFLVQGSNFLKKRAAACPIGFSSRMCHCLIEDPWMGHGPPGWRSGRNCRHGRPSNALRMCRTACCQHRINYTEFLFNSRPLTGSTIKHNPLSIRYKTNQKRIKQKELIQMCRTPTGQHWINCKMFLLNSLPLIGSQLKLFHQVQYKSN